ncbi:MAG TPA: hypothetical protein VFN02_16210 [Ktedonobacteraceae bacterium]|nr:hypothetical protein [Ktedonobacteraceae bacterium]
MTPPVASIRRTARGGRPIPSNRMLRAALLLLVVLMVANCGVPPTARGTPSPRASSLTATPAPPPFRPMVSIADAWGRNAAIATLSTQLDATHYMPNFGLAPDGRSLDGYVLTQVPNALIASVPAEAGVLDIASHQFTPIGVASLPKCIGSSCQDTGSASYYLNCCQTDGRFLIAQSTGYPGPDCGGCLYSYDQRTGTRYEVIPVRQYQGASTYLLDRGVLVAGTGTGIVIADLSEHTLKRLAGTTGSTQLDAFSWPYVVYGTPGGAQHTTTTSTPLQVYDVATGATTSLPQVTGSILALTDSTLYYVATPDDASGGSATLNELDNLAMPGAQSRALAALPSAPDVGLPQSLAITGDTLFYTVRTGLPGQGGCHPGWGHTCSTSMPPPLPVTTLYEVDNHLSGTPDIRALAAYAADLGDATVANARLVVLSGTVWDRTEERFVTLGTVSASGSGARPSRQDANGNFLLVAHALAQDWQAPFQVSIYDATRLSVLAN